MSETVMQIKRASALELMKWLGWNACDNWDNERIADKLSKVKEVYNEDEDGKPDSESVTATLISVMAAIEDEQTFEITGDEDVSNEPEPADDEDLDDVDDLDDDLDLDDDDVDDVDDDDVETPDDDLDDDEPAEESKAEPVAMVDEPEPEPEPKKESKAEKPKKTRGRPKGSKGTGESKPKEKKKAGIVAKNRRDYCAGVVVKKYGLDTLMKTGITDEMVKDVNELHGKANDNESKAYIKHAWHAINGYLKKYDIVDE